MHRMHFGASYDGLYKYRLFLRTALNRLVLGAFAKLRKATVSFVMSVCHSVSPSVRLPARKEQLFPHSTDFH